MHPFDSCFISCLPPSPPPHVKSSTSHAEFFGCCWYCASVPWLSVSVSMSLCLSVSLYLSFSSFSSSLSVCLFVSPWSWGDPVHAVDNTGRPSHEIWERTRTSQLLTNTTRRQHSSWTCHFYYLDLADTECYHSHARFARTSPPKTVPHPNSPHGDG